MTAAMEPEVFLQLSFIGYCEVLGRELQKKFRDNEHKEGEAELEEEADLLLLWRGRLCSKRGQLVLPGGCLLWFGPLLIEPEDVGNRGATLDGRERGR